MGEAATGNSDVQPAPKKAGPSPNALKALMRARASANRRAQANAPSAGPAADAPSSPANPAREVAAKAPVSNAPTSPAAPSPSEAAPAKVRKLPVPPKRKTSPTPPVKAPAAKTVAPEAAVAAAAAIVVTPVAEPANKVSAARAFSSPIQETSTWTDAEVTEEEAENQSIWRFLRMAGPAGTISLVVHVIIVLVAGLITFVVTRPELRSEILASAVDTPQEEIQNLEVVVEKIELPDDLTNLSPSQAMTTQYAEMASAAEPTTASADVGEAAPVVGAMGKIGDVFKRGTALDDVKNVGKMTTTFFGVKSNARRVVYVVDNSNSMGGGRFEAAVFEIMKSVSQLQASQQFYVIFFSDSAYPLFYPDTAPGFVPASTDNIYRLQKWLASVQNCLRTSGEEAMAHAFELSPDVIYLLGDGAFGDKTVERTLARKGAPIVIHTLGFDMTAANAAGFEQIAKGFSGRFTNVTVAPEFKALAKQLNRPHNSVRNGPWGLKLGNTPRKKK